MNVLQQGLAYQVIKWMDFKFWEVEMVRCVKLHFCWQWANGRSGWKFFWNLSNYDINRFLRVFEYTCSIVLLLQLYLSAICVEQFQSEPSPAIYRTFSCCKGHCLVPPSAWATGFRRGHCRSLHPVLEHTDLSAAAVCWHRLPGLQPCLVEARKRTGELLKPSLVTNWICGVFIIQ